MSDKNARADSLRNDDTDRLCRQADGYFLGQTPEGDIVIAFETGEKAQFGIFLDRAGAVDFLDRYTAEMEAMGFLT